MRIALLTDGIYPYMIGGMQKHSFNLALHLVRNEVEVDLYHFNQSPNEINRLELFSEEEKKRIRSFVVPFPDTGLLPGHYLRESYEYSKRILEEFLQNGPVDYVYSKGFTAWAMLDQKRKGLKLPPVGVNFHGYEMFQEAGSLKSRLEQFLLRGPVRFVTTHADQVFSYGGKISDIIRDLGVSGQNLIEIPSGIESGWLTDKITPVGPVRRFIFAGRYERRKGIEELNKVLLNWKGPSLDFVFVGPIPPNKQIKKEGVVYAGNCNSAEEMKKLLRNEDILVCPSHSEGMPNVILEGMASGLAIIATDVGAVSSMVDDSNGWLIQPHSESQLAKALNEAISLPGDLLDNKKTESLRRVKTQFQWDKIIHTTIERISEQIER